MARDLTETWLREGQELIAPGLLRYEVTSVLRNFVHRRTITPLEGDEAFLAFSDLPIEALDPPGLTKAAWDAAKRVGAARAYDMFYVALAQAKNCVLWTADRRLSNLVRPHFPLVRWVGDMQSQL